MQRFLLNIPLISSAPNGIARLRDLIYSLAVQGKLSQPDEEDESVNHLVDRIRRLKIERLKTRKSGQRRLPPRLHNELGFEIPKHWEWVQFGELGEWGAGSTPKRTESQFYGGSIVWLKSGELNNEVVFDSVEKVTEEALKRCSLRLNQPGDVLVAMYGATIGKLAIAGIECTTNQAVCGCTPFEGVLNKYLFILLKAAKPFFIANSSGAAQPNFSKEKIVRTSAPLPPLKEQKRIVSKVDELMKLCDELEVKQQSRRHLFPMLSRANHARLADRTTPANLAAIFTDPPTLLADDMRKTVLSLAVGGKLVPFGKETIHATLDSALREPSSNGVSRGPCKDKSATQVLRISAGTSRRDFYVNEDDYKHVELSQKEVDKHRLKAGDLLACRFNGNLHYVGRFSYYKGDSLPTQVNPDKLIRFRVDTAIHSSRFVCLMMNSPPIRLAIEAMCATTAGNIGLSAKKIKSVVVPLPNLETQIQVVERVDQLMLMIDDLETKQITANDVAKLFAIASTESLTSAT